MIKPLSVEKEYNVGFCGNINNRGYLIDSIDRQFGIRKDIFVLGDSMVRSINSYRIHFNANISIDINYRNFETIGCGTCLLTSYNRHYEMLGLRDKVNCLIYSTENEMLEKIETALNEDDFRKSLEMSALELAKYHTYKNRIKIIEEILK
jgi:spore maturation protein CgeB